MLTVIHLVRQQAIQGLYLRGLALYSDHCSEQAVTTCQRGRERHGGRLRRGQGGFRRDRAALDVTSLHHRRATHRWERTSVGDLFERMTWSFPDHEALVGRAGAYGHETFHRVTYAQADRLANQIANGLLAAACGTATWSCCSARTRSRAT